MFRAFFHKPGLSRFAAFWLTLSAPLAAPLTVTLTMTLWLSGCDTSLSAFLSESLSTPSPVAAEEASERQPGGATTVSVMPFPAFDKVVPNLPADAKADFFAGRALADQPWVKAPTTTTASDGLGPVYNARTCLACHIRGGKGRLPDDNHTPLFNAFLRVSLPARAATDVNPAIGVIPEPTYGDQLQGQSVALLHQLRSATPEAIAASGDVPPEAYVYVIWQEHTVTYPDGQTVTLRKPLPDIRHLGYGPLHPDTLFSLRNAPAIHGMGLLEGIAQADLNALADPDDANGDGISGRVNQVWDARTQRTVPGRFGLKANRPTMDMVVASAFANDVGISNELFPAGPCAPAQSRCLSQANGNDDEGVELPAHLLALVTEFSRNLGVPERRQAAAPEVQAGRTLFYQTGCQACHHPDYITADDPQRPHLSGQHIWPYTDLLLHDMGDDLADGRPDFAASGREWRTPPLWGVGLLGQVNGSNSLLHDGRARSVEEAVLWHGGEAAAARQRFMQLEQSQRSALLRFVESL
ncbi:di-heme oxidoredictase family protein [Thalassolituus sp. LLYu03]|uniref:di-heme oxidoreductase family protein n=1 Tax=Thalassolituus sp. LLYu03 TaxID=3421656 RepID=UPI003D27214B